MSEGTLPCVHRRVIHLSTPGSHERRGLFMRERRLTALMTLCAAVAATLLISTQFMSAQNGKGKEGKGNDKDQPPPFYNPYPSGILPADLSSEIARVIREVDFIESEALATLR